MLDPRPLFHPSYWLTLDPPAVYAGAGRFLAVFFAAMIVAALVLRRACAGRAKDRHEADVYRRVARLFATMGTVGLVLFFFSYEQIRILGARFLYLAWIVGTVAWAAAIVRRARRQIPEARRREQERAERNKYIPGRRA